MPRSFLPHFFFQVSSIFIDNYRLSMYYMRFGCSCPIFVLAFASIFGLSRDFLINWDLSFVGLAHLLDFLFFLAILVWVDVLKIQILSGEPRTTLRALLCYLTL